MGLATHASILSIDWDYCRCFGMGEESSVEVYCIFLSSDDAVAVQ